MWLLLGLQLYFVQSFVAQVVQLGGWSIGTIGVVGVTPCKSDIIVTLAYRSCFMVLGGVGINV